VTLLRQGLLDGRAIALAGGVPPPLRDALGGLGARVEELDLALEPGLDEERASAWAGSVGPLYSLVYDAGPAFGGGGPDGLRECLERGWVAVRGVATGALIPAGAGKVVLIAPRPDAGSFAAAARDALENLARTLSVEWARYGVGTVAIAPGVSATDEEVAELVSFLVSPAGEYFTGCVFDLGASTLIRSS
jgi:NAD(P)-dependent dehydrogenase (short-subunit alcohol dehydrogenase family)